MTKTEITNKMLEVLESEFEIKNPDMGDNLREKYEFDSIDAIDMLVIIENYLGSTLTVEERKKAIEIRTLDDICKYVEELAQTRNLITE